MSPNWRISPPASLSRGAWWRVAALALGVSFAGPALAQVPATKQATDRLLLQAQEMVYDRDHGTIEARGQVQIYYQGRVLQADRVIYDRERKRVFAQGRAKLTETDGTVSYGDRIELTDDFKSGFVDSLRGDTTDKTYMTAARAERIDGNVNVMERGTYTACAACEEDPSKPPMWQVRGKRIIHNREEQTVYYEDATLEFMGVPVAYVPYLSTPDAVSQRKTGFLAPRYTANSNVGVGVGLPFFWNVAPNKDLTITPTFYSQQGLHLDAEWRHQFVTGSYRVRGSGIFQRDSSTFQSAPNGPGNKDFRGAFETSGQFFLNEQWRFGWDITLLTDRWVFQDYRLPVGALSSNYFRESISTVFLNGQSDRAYFDARVFYFQGLSRYDLQDQQPIVGPVIDYNKSIDLRPISKGGIGGQIEIDANIMHLNRSLAAYQSTGTRTLDSVYKLYDICSTYDRTNCLVRGVGGDYTRATANVTWKQQFIDNIGQVWTPFVFTRVNGAFLTLNSSNTVAFDQTGTAGTYISNSYQSTFLGTDANSWLGQITPGIGLDYRFPFTMATSWGTHVLEPIAQVIVRPNEITNASLVNEDSQSLVFDDTNLFMWNKFSGYDRFEGGTRANYGGQYTMNFANGGYANFMLGQSMQLAGTNSYGTPDAANIGLSSGLDSRRSDIVSRIGFAPNPFLSIMAKGRFDPVDYSVRRFDVAASARVSAKVEGSLQYARYEAQPLIGYDKRREGVSTALKYKFHPNYYAAGNVIFDLSRHLYNTNSSVGGRAGLFSMAGMGAGVGYMDDCTTIAVNYASIYQDKGTGSAVRNQTVLVQLQLRTLGDTRVTQSLGSVKVEDGLSGMYAP